jgi:uncharacterized protein YcbX
MGTASRQRLGRIDSVWRYPVKSMAGERLASAFVGFNGVAGDRVFAFVDQAKKGKDDFPWFTAREQHELLLYKPRFKKPLDPADRFPDPAAYGVVVDAPDGRAYDVADPALKAALRAEGAGKTFDFELRFSEKGMPDARPVALFSMNTVAALTTAIGAAVDHRRFRANLYVRWDDPAPFFEDSLVGRSLQIGERLTLNVVKKDPRCIIITMDPDTAAVKPEILKHVARQRQGCVGVYAAVLKDGMVSEGDEIFLLG